MPAHHLYRVAVGSPPLMGHSTGGNGARGERGGRGSFLGRPLTGASGPGVKRGTT